MRRGIANIPPGPLSTTIDVLAQPDDKHNAAARSKKKMDFIENIIIPQSDGCFFLNPKKNN